MHEESEQSSTTSCACPGLVVVSHYGQPHSLLKDTAMSQASDEHVKKLFEFKDITRQACCNAKRAIGKHGGSICKTFDYIMSLMILKCKSQAAFVSRERIAEAT